VPADRIFLRANLSPAPSGTAAALWSFCARLMCQYERAALDGVDVMTLSELINWHRAEGIAAWKKYEHALTYGFESAARFRGAFIAHGETVEGLTELHCRRQTQLATGTV
jgi:hypothetical protein